MIEAMIAGERDAAVLAEMAKGKMRPKIAALTEALDGNFGTHHAAAARALLDHVDFLDRTIEALTDEIAARLEPMKAAVQLLCTIPGVSERTAEVIVSETGADMGRFPTAGHLAAWAGVAPGSHESAGRRRPAGTRQGGRWLRRTVVEAAHAAARTHGTYLAAQCRRVAARRGENRAAVAVAHSIIVAAWHMLNTGQRYEDLGADYFRDRSEPEAEARRLIRRLETLGHHVSIQPVA
jgi:transposase